MRRGRRKGRTSSPCPKCLPAPTRREISPSMRRLREDRPGRRSLPLQKNTVSTCLPAACRSLSARETAKAVTVRIACIIRPMYSAATADRSASTERLICLISTSREDRALKSRIHFLRENGSGVLIRNSERSVSVSAMISASPRLPASWRWTAQRSSWFPPPST